MSMICGCYDTTVCDRFEREIKEHRAEIALKQDGYLHMKCRKPNGSSYWFDIIVVPGSLTFRGDGESYSFHACSDMVDFFRHGFYHGKIHINTTYWAEKVTSSRDGLKGHDVDDFKKYVLSMVDSDTEAEYPGVRKHLAKAMRAAEEDWGSEYDLNDERSAREFLENYSYKGFGFSDVWEMDLRSYDWWFLWALHAIVWAVNEHDKIYGKPGTQDVSKGEDITASLAVV